MKLVAAICGPRWDVYHDAPGSYVPALAHVAIDTMVGCDSRAELEQQSRVVIGTLRRRSGIPVDPKSTTADGWHVSVLEADHYLFTDQPRLTKQLVSAFHHIYTIGAPSEMESARDLERRLRSIRSMKVSDFRNT